MMDDQEKRNISVAIRDYIARNRMSREAFAFKTRLGKSTVDKLLIGLFSDKTLSTVEEATQTRFRHFGIVEAKAGSGVGGYIRSDITMYEGTYRFIRPSFKDKNTIYAFPMEIVWSDDIPGLTLRQSPPSGTAQSGVITIPKVSLHIFIYSDNGGSTQHLILSRLDTRLKMKGLMLTLANFLANSYTPVAVPVVLIKTSDLDGAHFGRITAEHPSFETYRREILDVDQDGYGRLFSPADL